MFEGGWLGQDIPGCSTSMMDMMLNSRRKECIRKDRRASCDPLGIGGFLGPIVTLSVIETAKENRFNLHPVMEYLAEDRA
jgi:hypothetical protein